MGRRAETVRILGDATFSSREATTAAIAAMKTSAEQMGQPQLGEVLTGWLGSKEKLTIDVEVELPPPVVAIFESLVACIADRAETSTLRVESAR